MNILGIETSCDETAAAVVKNGRVVLSNTVMSSLKEHSRYGGVIPEIASRRQMEFINLVVKKAIDDSTLTLKNIDAIAVTVNPGLIGSLLVGNSFARALAYSLNKPLIEVDHIQAHLYASFLSDGKNDIPKLPVIGLVVSGGHTSLYKITNFNKYVLLGKTLDDAAGEAFDKVAKILELGYPGGPIIEKSANKAVKKDLIFKCAELPGTLDFSFSGIKTSVLYYFRDNKNKKDFKKVEVAYAFQKSVTEILVKKSISACREHKINTLVLGGGVAANSFLRKALYEAVIKYRIKAYFPKMSLCTDNGAMIAGLGAQQFVRR